MRRTVEVFRVYGGVARGFGLYDADRSDDGDGLPTNSDDHGGASQIAAGSTMHAFGLLFYDGGHWKMVASRLG
jgi:hypothetical protein